MASPNNRAVYIGGFGNGRKVAEGVGNALTDVGGHSDAEVFTYAYAMDNPDEVARAAAGAKLYSHSAGLGAAKDTRPSEIFAVAPPLPTSAKGLMLKSGLKSARMAKHSLVGSEELRAVSKYNASAVAELARHPVGNLKHLREIARTNSIDLALSAKEAGILTTLYFMDRDDFGFVPNEEQRSFANVLGIELHMLEGRHDQLPLYPANALEQIHGTGH